MRSRFKCRKGVIDIVYVSYFCVYGFGVVFGENKQNNYVRDFCFCLIDQLIFFFFE